jgi:hypothetical protein
MAFSSWSNSTRTASQVQQNLHVVAPMPVVQARTAGATFAQRADGLEDHLGTYGVEGGRAVDVDLARKNLGLGFANAGANNRSGRSWMSLDRAEGGQQVTGQIWTLVDVLRITRNE